MGAPFGNKFWELREKHGKDRVVESPEKLWETAMAYFKYVDENPEQETDFRGKDAVEVKIPRKLPYTMHDLCLFIGVNTEYLRKVKLEIKDKTDDKSKDYQRVIRDIEDIVYSHKYKGAVAGFFNANIIARDLGLSDKQTVVNTDIKGDSIDYSKLSPEVLKQIAEASKDQPDEQY